MPDPLPDRDEVAAILDRYIDRIPAVRSAEVALADLRRDQVSDARELMELVGRDTVILHRQLAFVPSEGGIMQIRAGFDPFVCLDLDALGVVKPTITIIRPESNGVHIHDTDEFEVFRPDPRD